MKQEIWKDITDYEGLYKVSNLGRVKSLKNDKEKILKPVISSNGYLFVNLCKQGKQKPTNIHRIVAKAFIPNPNNLPIINHKDEDKTNNCVNNLEWCTYQYNNTYGSRIDRFISSNRNNPKTSKKVLCVETNKIYHSVRQIERDLGFGIGNIWSCCNGKYKQAYGYTWRYVN